MDLFPKQFVIAGQRFQAPHEWEEHALGNMSLARSPSLPLVEIQRQSTIVGLILGWFSDGSAFRHQGGTKVIDDHESVSSYTRTLAGRFVTIICDGSAVSIGTDPTALLPVVFDMWAQAAGSSPRVLQLLRECHTDSKVVDSVVRYDGKIWYPFGLTPYEGVRRLLPGERLDLTTATLSRSNPPSPVKDDSKPSLDTTARIFARSVEHVRAFATPGGLNAHLTAGYDSRMVLALTMAARTACTFYTIKTPGRASALDCETAHRLACLASVDHTVKQYLPPSTAECEAWMDRTGYCIRDAVTSLCRTVTYYDDGRYTLTGTCGEIGRAFYWTAADMGCSHVSPDLLLYRLGFKPSQYLLSLAEDWLNQFDEGSARSAILDQAYIQLRLPCWAGPSVVGHLVDKPTLTPFNCEDSIRDLLSLQEEYRVRQYFAQDFIALGNADLLHVPFNRASGLRRLLSLRDTAKDLMPETLKRLLKTIKAGTRSP